MKERTRRKVIRATAGCLFLGSALVIWHFTAAATQHAVSPQEFFSDDDGATWFADDATKLAPFDHHGKQAVLAKVYQCPGEPAFVGYLEKFSDEAKAKIDSSRNGRPMAGIAATTGPSLSTLLLKKPHDDKWVSNIDPTARAVKIFSSPDGRRDYLPVLP